MLHCRLINVTTTYTGVNVLAFVMRKMPVLSCLIEE